jgi:hypothetical protein
MVKAQHFDHLSKAYGALKGEHDNLLGQNKWLWKERMDQS